MITRFSVLPDERKLLLGIDTAGLFEPGMVYEAIEILDEIVLRKLGLFAFSKKGHPSINSTTHTIINYGQHLFLEKKYQDLCDRDNL